MGTTIAKWGNSLGVRIPANILHKVHLKAGDRLMVDVNRNGQIVLEPQKADIDFSALYAQITPENRYKEVGAGSEIGNESVVW